MIPNNLAAVRAADFEFGEFVERAFEDQVRQRNRGLEREADSRATVSDIVNTCGMTGARSADREAA